MALHLIDRVVVEEEGAGDDVVFCVHGLGGSANTFQPLLPALARQRVVRIDLPGSGRSQHAEGTLSIERYVDGVQAACARLAVPRAHFVGHSMGTIVLQHLAVAAPRLVQSLALFGPLIVPPDTAKAAIRERAAKARSGGAAGMHEITLGLLNAALSADTRQRQPLAVGFVRESLLRQEPAAYARSCEALAGATAAVVERIACPVLLVTGDEDGVAPPQAVRDMAGRLRGAASVRVEVLAKCGHWTPVERVDECQRLLREFLAGVRS